MISEFPLFVFTTLAGLAAGAYIANALFPLDRDRRTPWAFPLVCLVLLGVGLLGCLMHLARPGMFLNALANYRAGIAQEAYFSIAFGIVLIADLIVTWRKGDAPRALRIVGAVLALILTVIMGLAYISTFGVSAWCTWATVPLFVVGDLAMGFALYALFAKGAYKSQPFFMMTLALAALLAVTLVCEAVHFAGLGLGIVPFVAAIVVAPAASGALAVLASKRDDKALPAAVFAAVLVGVCIARWAFYAASII
ncbi:DmsC/YnfH family molybdoenzyme membrane anchor subunit [Adlercreutzia sp. ZJ473]|uniref:DmsC/YnfH family molybdoenzyme membrane anchor subunit n=1 Tax=Adlercreutzia sp. ZJ473 TaxID=2722822 RepID=UPI0020A6D4AA|nr:DmsC/YnfH family molybdoenzyme membrane anchor subunit [Adlercreutzia sp. ZJ473]